MAVRNINANEFNNLLQGDKPLLVDYWAPWCGYCRRIGPVYEKIGQQYGEAVDVVKINIDEEAALAEAERIEVIPTLVLYRGGAVLGSLVAPPSKAAIDAFLEEKLNG